MSSENPWTVIPAEQPESEPESETEDSQEQDHKNPEKKRVEMAFRLVSQYMPDDPEQEFLESLAEQGVKIDELDRLPEDKRQRIEYIRLKCSHKKEEIAKEFAGFAIPTEELDRYIVEVMSFEKEVAEYEPQMKGFSHKESRISHVVAQFDSLEKVQFWRHLFEEWKPIIEKEKDETSKKYKKNAFFDTFAKQMTGYNIWPKRPERDEKEITEYFDTYKEIHAFLANLPDELKELPLEKDFIREFRGNFFDIALNNNDPKQARIYFLLFKDCLAENDPGVATKYLRSIGHYGRNHSLSEQSLEGFEKKLYPAIESNDPQVEALQEAGNYWGMKKDDFGIADFVVHSYALETSPKNINELLMVLREIPTSNFAKLEQNRRDALSMGSPFGGLRDLIHDQHPLVREVVQAMIEYYEDEAHDKSRLESLLSKTGGYLDKALLSDLARYDQQVLVEVGGKRGQEKAINVLKRVKENVQSFAEMAPATSDIELNRELSALEKDKGAEAVSS